MIPQQPTWCSGLCNRLNSHRLFERRIRTFLMSNTVFCLLVSDRGVIKKPQDGLLLINSAKLWDEVCQRWILHHGLKILLLHWVTAFIEFLHWLLSFVVLNVVWPFGDSNWKNISLCQFSCKIFSHLYLYFTCTFTLVLRQEMVQYMYSKLILINGNIIIITC